MYRYICIYIYINIYSYKNALRDRKSMGRCLGSCKRIAKEFIRKLVQLFRLISFRNPVCNTQMYSQQIHNLIRNIIRNCFGHIIRKTNYRRNQCAISQQNSLQKTRRDLLWYISRIIVLNERRRLIPQYLKGLSTSCDKCIL